jgi:acyl carrier protein
MDIEQAIYDALLAIDPAIPHARNTPLTGPDSQVDSLGLINVLQAVEEAALFEGFDVSLTDDAAVDAVPWATVGSLVAYVEERMA